MTIYGDLIMADSVDDSLFFDGLSVSEVLGLVLFVLSGGSTDFSTSDIGDNSAFNLFADCEFRRPRSHGFIVGANKFWSGYRPEIGG